MCMLKFLSTNKIIEIQPQTFIAPADPPDPELAKKQVKFVKRKKNEKEKALLV